MQQYTPGKPKSATRGLNRMIFIDCESGYETVAPHNAAVLHEFSICKDSVGCRFLLSWMAVVKCMNAWQCESACSNGEVCWAQGQRCTKRCRGPLPRQLATCPRQLPLEVAASGRVDGMRRAT